MYRPAVFALSILCTCINNADAVLSKYAPMEIWRNIDTSNVAEAAKDGTNALKLKCALQALEVYVNPDSTVFRSTSPSEGMGNFFIMPVFIGDGILKAPISAAGNVSSDNRHSIMIDRDLLAERFSSDADGICQDFIIKRKTEGREGKICLDLRVNGATLSGSGRVTLVLPSGRKLFYGRLKTRDMMGRSLSSSMALVDHETIRISIDDVGAVYPLTIDPTVTDADWEAMNRIPGTDGKVKAILRDSGRLYIAGCFKYAGSVVANNIAMWDGADWHALGHGMRDTIVCLAKTADGTLYAGGRFYLLDNPNIRYIARWNGIEWKSLDLGTDSEVTSMALDGNGDLCVGGRFTKAGEIQAINFARWNGTAWDTLGRWDYFYSSSKYTRDICFLTGDDRGNLYAVHSILSGIHKWDGTQWTKLSWDYGNTPTALCCDSGGTLYVGAASGRNVLVSRIFRWNGNGWDTLGDSIQAQIHAITFDKSGTCYAGCMRSFNAPDSSFHSVLKWNGTVWDTVGNWINKPVYAVISDGSGGIYAAGDFNGNFNGTTNYDVPWNIAGWNGKEWQPLSPAVINGDINAILYDGKKNILYVGGEFSRAGISGTSCIAQWNGSFWDSLGAGITPTQEAFHYATKRGVQTLALDSSGNLYAGGKFIMAGNEKVQNIARWDGVRWHSLGTGLYGKSRVTYLTEVSALACGKNGSLVAVGNFDTAGGVHCKSTAQWDGVAWSALGEGGLYSPRALAFDDNGYFYEGGSGDTMSYDTGYSSILKWDGTKWTRLPAIRVDQTCDVYSMAFDGKGNLYAGGYFPFIAKWNGAQWSGTDSVFDDKGIRSIVFDRGGNLYACTYDLLAKWDGISWNYQEINQSLMSTLAVADSTLYIGGMDLIVAGKSCSPFLMKVAVDPTPASVTYKRLRGENSVVPGFHYRNNRLIFSDIRKNDQIIVSSLSGRCIRKVRGIAEVSLAGITPQIVMFLVNRSGKALLSGMVRVR